MNISHAFDTFPSNPGFPQYLSLVGEKADPVEVFMAVYAAALHNLPTTKEGCRYSCEYFCGPELWNRYPSDGQHRALGIALKHLVNEGALPIECVKPHWNNKFYTPKEYGALCAANALTVVQQPSLSDRSKSTILQEV